MFEKVIRKYYHDGHCNAGRHQPMGCSGCSCFMYKRVLKAELGVCPLKGQLKEARGTALWTIEKRKMEIKIDGLKSAIVRAQELYEENDLTQMLLVLEYALEKIK